MRKTMRIADFGTVITGKTPSSNNPEHFGDAFPFITPTDMGSGRIVHTERGISQEGYFEYRRKVLPPKSICFVCIGATIGKICLTTRRSLTNQQINSVVVDTAQHDPLFVYYLLSTYAETVKGIAGGAATPIVNKTSFENIEVDVPPLPTQRKIAAILSAYDDLIENNLRRIKILEEMAQNLYREWFVKFRFPGHQRARLVDSPLGKIPEGWEVKTLADAVTVRPPLPVPKNERIPFVSMGSLSENSMLISDVEHRAKASGARFQNGDTLFARITPCLENGKTGFVQFLPTDDAVACGSTEFIVLRSKTLCPEYVYLMARSDPFRDNAIKSMSGATGRQRVQEECFTQFLLAQPLDAILDHFQMIARPQFELIFSLNRRNMVLRRTRDLLLPRLISGEVDVSELDIAVPKEDNNA